MPIKRGDIVLANLPFTDLSGAKIRPALVVQCDANNSRLHDVILAMITRTTKHAAAEPTQLLSRARLRKMSQQIASPGIKRIVKSPRFQISSCIGLSLPATALCHCRLDPRRTARK